VARWVLKVLGDEYEIDFTFLYYYDEIKEATMVRRLLLLSLLMAIMAAWLGCGKGNEKESESQAKSEESLKNPGLEFVFVKGGTFEMGDTFVDDDGDEKPVHSVTVSSFYIGKYEVTQREWKEIMGSNPSDFKGDNLPVEKVSWHDAIRFCNKKSKIEGLTPCYSGSGSNVSCNFSANGYRLITEAEWEYAARGGSKSRGYKYSGSSNPDEVVWYRDNSGSKTHQGGRKKANELGLHDMSGNVWEWCWDWYDEGYYRNSPSNNPKGPSSGNDRVLRGGYWGDDTWYVRCTDRFRGNPGVSYSGNGFRYARTF